MIRRFRILIALFAVAMQVTDGIVGAMGHSHSEKTACCETKTHDRHCGKCSHHCHDEAAEQENRDSHQSGPQSDPHGDCSLCRHFSQPVVVIPLTIEIAGNDYSEVIAGELTGRIIEASRPIHPARGPPALCA